MHAPITLAIVGATGLVGEALLEVLDERDFPLAELFALASERSLGRSVGFRGRSLAVQELERFDFARCQLVFFCAPAECAQLHAPRALESGCIVIDTSARFRLDAQVPLVVPEVNAATLADFGTHGLIASPAALTVQLATVLKPLHDAAGVEHVAIATYEAVSGAGRGAVEALAQQSIAALSGRGLPQEGAAPLAFNCVPQVLEFEHNGYTGAEMGLVHELRRVLDAPDLSVQATAVRVPVFYGNSCVARVTLRRPMGAPEARRRLENAPAVTLRDVPQEGGYPTAATEAANRDTVYVGRIREDLAPDGGLNLWIVADNIRRGAATNCVQIAQTLVRQPI